MDIDEPECPGPDCPFCSGEACDLCGAGCWDGSITDCDHDVLERHRLVMPVYHSTCETCRQVNRVCEHGLTALEHSQFYGSRGQSIASKPLDLIQREVGEWTVQFGDNVSKDEASRCHGQVLDSTCTFLGMVEELGELAHAMIYRHQGRGLTAEEAAEKKKDAVADFAIFCMDFCNREGIDWLAEINRAWEKVQKRRRKSWMDDKAAEFQGAPEAALGSQPGELGSNGGGTVGAPPMTGMKPSIVSNRDLGAADYRPEDKALVSGHSKEYAKVPMPGVPYLKHVAVNNPPRSPVCTDDVGDGSTVYDDRPRPGAACDPAMEQTGAGWAEPPVENVPAGNRPYAVGSLEFSESPIVGPPVSISHVQAPGSPPVGVSEAGKIRDHNYNRQCVQCNRRWVHKHNKFGICPDCAQENATRQRALAKLSPEEQRVLGV